LNINDAGRFAGDEDFAVSDYAENYNGSKTNLGRKQKCAKNKILKMGPKLANLQFQR